MTCVLVVDDSQFMQTVVGNALTAAGYDVCTARTGDEALELVEANEPDVITMDVEMPGMGGLEAVERIMSRNPTPILMLSAHTERGAKATLEALERGALDFLPKSASSSEQNIAHLADAVVEKVDALSEATVSSLALARATAAVHATKRQVPDPDRHAPVSSVTAGGANPATASPRTSRRVSGADTPGTKTPVEGPLLEHPTIVIGASTGGPKIIERVVAGLPSALEAKVLIVQHMPPDFTKRLADRLNSASEYDVREASDGDRVRAGDVVIAKGGHHLTVTDNDGGALEVALTSGPRVHGVRPSIDVTMETAAETVTDPLCGVVLTGMGKDGAAGIEAINAAGGHTIAQDEATSPVFGIPRQAIETGCVDEVVPASALVDRIVDAFTTDGETDD